MSESNRRGVAAALVLGSIVALLAGYVSWGWGLMSWQRDDADRRAYQRAEYAESYIERACIGMDRARLIECIKESIDTSREDQRSEYDLNAQENMGRWAWWLLMTSIATVFTAGVGIYYVRETLIEGQRASDVAREMGQRQIRAYVQFSHVDCIPIASPKDAKERIGFNIRIGFVNKGSTSARDCWCTLNGGVFEPLTWPLRLPPRSGEAMHTGNSLGVGGIQFPPPFFVSMDEMIQFTDGEKGLIFSSRADYIDVFDEPRFTEVCIGLEPACHRVYLDSRTIDAEKVFSIGFVGPNNRAD